MHTVPKTRTNHDSSKRPKTDATVLPDCLHDQDESTRVSDPRSPEYQSELQVRHGESFEETQ
ncbi:hypothetical protein [Natrialba chahannaoensis]|uniref:hypothetical protein n=1 Tax=Natrialba chahannaoensis TaxID=68911 RepID=UPI000A96F612|nr:hypothetical protein [Natrialba chahannaoensis]